MLDSDLRLAVEELLERYEGTVLVDKLVQLIDTETDQARQEGWEDCYFEMGGLSE